MRNVLRLHQVLLSGVATAVTYACKHPQSEPSQTRLFKAGAKVAGSPPEQATATFARRHFRIVLRCLISIFLIWVVPRLSGQIYNWTTIAGNAGWGSTDGTNSDGRFWAPVGMASDQFGNLYVTDYRSDTIRKISPAGTNWVVTTLAGLAGSQGSADGTNSTARFYSPVGIAVSSQGNIFVADCYNYTIRMLSPAGTNWAVTTIAGKARTFGSHDGTNSWPVSALSMGWWQMPTEMSMWQTVGIAQFANLHPWGQIGSLPPSPHSGPIRRA